MLRQNSRPTLPGSVAPPVGVAERGSAGSAGLVVFLAVTLVLLMVLIALVARRREVQRAGAGSGTAQVEPPVPQPPGNIRDDRETQPDTPRVDTTEVDTTGIDTTRPGGPEAEPAPPLRTATGAERAARTEEGLRRVLGAVGRFRHIVGRNPRDLSELARPISGHADGILGAAGAPADGWGRPFGYGGRTGSTGRVWVMSHGADGAEGGSGTDGDLVATFDD